MSQRKGLDELRHERIRVRIAELKKEIDFHARAQGDHGRWKPFAEASLAAAEGALEAGNLQAAWPSCHQAARFLYESLGEGALEDRANIVRREAEEKLQNWRREAVFDLLGRDVHQARKASAGTVVAAQFLLDEHFGNVYFKLEALANRALGMMAALASFVLLILLLPCIGKVPPDSFLSEHQQIVPVLLLGGLGATLSRTLSTLGLTGRIPTVIKGGTEYVVRPLLGALSSVVVLVVLQAELIPVDAPTGRAMYGWAVAAGFSDQILNRVIGRLEQSMEK